jgi:DNA polymerase III delta subunit
MSIFEFYEESKKGFSGVYLLYSSEPFLFQDALNTIENYLRAQQSEIRKFDMEEKPPLSSIIEELRTPFFFGSNTNSQWIIIKSAHLLKKKEIKEIAEFTVADSNLIFFFGKKPDKDFLEFFKNSKLISLDLKDEEVPEWLQYKAKEFGLTLSKEVIDYILQKTEGEPAIIYSELYKLHLSGLFAPTLKDMKEIFNPYSEYDLKDLLRAIKNKDKAKTLLILRSLKEDPSYIVGALNNFFSSSPFNFKRGKEGVEYKKILPILHEMDLRAKTQKDFLEPLLLKLLELVK